MVIVLWDLSKNQELEIICNMPNSTQNQTSANRPPIVVVLGHVDHGKTSVLDYIRKSKVAQGESGGITQHIGAYQVDHPVNPPGADAGQVNKKITFIDTPGHEAFSAMRSRGAKVADIAILIVAADESVKPQTKEAIGHILRLGMPFVVAINKMDKPAALPDKVKKELADNGVLVESLGGKIPSVFVSAKTGLGINDLLEMILLLWEMENSNLSAMSEKLPIADRKFLIGNKIADKLPIRASGIIIESRLDPGKGPVATALVKEGILTEKDAIATESAYGIIKSMEDFRGKRIEEAGPATPILITGLNQVPPVGEEWSAVASLQEAKDKVAIKIEKEKHKREPAEIMEITPDKKVLNIILKADVTGSLEAIREALQSIPQDEVMIRIVKSDVGDIGENDIKLASSAKAEIYGFRVKKQSNTDQLVERLDIKVETFEIIYELIQKIRQSASALLEPEITAQKIGRIRVLASFKSEGTKQIVGGRVLSGKAERNANFLVVRNEEEIGKGKITQLQQNKQNIAEVAKDKECGMMIESQTQLEKNDILDLFKEEKKKREL